MIISKTPFRISLFGGSTDYESFYKENGSLLVGFAIDKYCYLNVRKTPKIFSYKTSISYSRIEKVYNNSDIQHDGVRGVLEYLNEMDNGYEISHLSDLPSQTGTGSSSSFVVGLIRALRSESDVCPYTLAKLAIDVERKHLKEEGGIQDQIWAAFGGFNSIQIHKNGEFEVRPLPICKNFINDFFNRSFLIYTGRQRKSYAIASSHNTGPNDKNKMEIYKLAQMGYNAFLDEDMDKIAHLIKKSWDQKKKISNLICTDHVSDIFSKLEDGGMIGGKLLGSGGSGFIFGIAKDYESVLKIKSDFENFYIDVGLSTNGSEIINK